MIGIWTDKIRMTEALLAAQRPVQITGLSSASSEGIAIARFSIFSALAADEEKTVRRALLVFRLFVTFLEFCVQFTVILGLAFVVLRIFQGPFWLLAAIVYLAMFLLAFTFVLPSMTKQINAARKRRGQPPLSKSERRAMFGHALKGYLFNALITTLVLFLAAAIVGASPTIGNFDYGSVIRDNSYALAGATLSGLVFSLLNQFFGVPIAAGASGAKPAEAPSSTVNFSVETPSRSAVDGLYCRKDKSALIACNECGKTGKIRGYSCPHCKGTGYKCHVHGGDWK